MPKKKILIFTIPNEGHLNILKRMIARCQSSFEFRLVFTARKNTQPNVSDLAINVSFLPSAHRFKNTPAWEVLTRVFGLLDECLSVTKEYQPDVIIYDFYCIEGYFVGKLLGIPAWSSIPAMVGPFVHQKYREKCVSTNTNRQAIKYLGDRFTLKIDTNSIEVIGNCLHIPGDLNLIWSYPVITSPDAMENRKKTKYVFMGYLIDENFPRQKRTRTETPLIYLSFGTEVMDNLWITQARTRGRIKKFVAHLAHLWKEKHVKVMFATQGKKVLSKYPDSWTVCKMAHQQKILLESDVFVSHGGSNSFHEALLSKVPMVLIPFFADQALTAQRAEELKIGIRLIENIDIDKRKSKAFLNETLADSVDRSVFQILNNTARYQKTYEILHQKLTHTTSLEDLVRDELP